MSFSELPETLGFTIIRTGKMLLRSINGSFVLLTSEITFEQMGILYYISKHKEKEMIQQDLAEVMEKTKSAVLRSIDILEKKGFVKRASVEGDRRKNMIEITASGKKIIDKMHSIFLKQEEVLAKGISKKELDTCISVLSRIQKKCK